ncbi:MAG: hypothetical protein H6Q90_1434 [Deltaproteobacteria bacterium]|nr:hypothetical protein [Deltaproteobacteria bacterium]
MRVLAEHKASFAQPSALDMLGGRRTMRALLAVLVVAGCSGKQAPEPQLGSAPAPAGPVAAPAAVPATAPADAAPATAILADAATAAPPLVAAGGVDFIDDARRLYRVAGCGGEGPLPVDLFLTITVPPSSRDENRYKKRQTVVDRHCKAISKDVEKFRETYYVKARKWFEDKLPADAPTEIVYPFGGGDLISVLAAFPRATVFTSISLELAGDPRKLRSLTPEQLDLSLAAFRKEISWLISLGSNTSVNLSAQQRNELPGQVSSFLLALAVGGYEPVAMRYFTLDDKGAIHYVEQAEIDADKTATKALSGSWNKPTFAASFRNVELAFRKIGDTRVIIHRHIAWNLDDKHLAESPGVLKHLEAKGKVTMVVKGASYLLWLKDFHTMKQYVIDHLAWMISDSTGIGPKDAKAANFVQEPYGKFLGPGLPHAAGLREDAEMQALWKDAKPAPFRWGYIDRANNAHLMITRPK